MKKIASFLPKPWTNPFGKILILQRFNFLFFIVLKCFLTFYNNAKHILLVDLPKIKNMEKLKFLTKTMD